MSVAAVGVEHQWDVLLRAWREVDPPGEGWRAEIDEHRIALMPPPGEPRNLIASRIHRALVSRLPIEWEVFQTMGVQVPHVERLYVPDLCVIPSDVFPTAKPPVEGAEALLVVEITSPSNVEHDRKKRRWAYAHAPVPLYLLVDAYDVSGPSVTLYSHPNNGDYGTIAKERFGAQVHLPEPFGFDIDTEVFPEV